MKNILPTIIFLLVSSCLSAQETLAELLKTYNSDSIPYISVTELDKIQKNIVLLDAREKNEFLVSHIDNAKFVGYNRFKTKNFKKLNLQKSDTIVVYCSLGVRSEDIAQKIKKIGYPNVYNLYGGIFEWKNNDLPVVDTNQQPTENVHAFSKEWGKWLLKGKKVYKN